MANLLSILLHWCWIIILSGFIFLLPGFTLLIFLWTGWKKSSWEVPLSISASAGLAIYPILFLLAKISRIPINQKTVLLFFIINAGLLLGKLTFHLLKTKTKFLLPSLISIKNIDGFSWFLFLTICSILFTRFWSIRNLVAPMWGDSVHHTTITQLLFENEGLFNSWQPYAPYSSFTMQFGFPANATILMWLANISSSDAVLFSGQVINCLAVFSLYPLSLKISQGNRWAALSSLIVAGLLSPLPGGYTNWGRYAQLTGQAILPIALWSVWELLETPLQTDKTSFKYLPWRKIFFSAILLCGMLLAYYRLAFYFGAFIVALLLVWTVNYWKQNRSLIKFHLVMLFLIASITIILFLPWLFQIRHSILVSQTQEALVNETRPLNLLLADYLIWRDIFNYVPIVMVILFLISMIWGVFKRKWLVVMIGIWVLLLVLLVASQVLKIPIANFMQNFAIMIALYIPVSLAVGWLIGELLRSVFQIKRFSIIYRSILTIVFFTSFFFGIRFQTNLINPEKYALVHKTDLKALQWIRNKTPKDALFLVEGMLVPPGTSAVGTDAGWWIPLLGQRANTMPPQYAMLNEIPEDPLYNQKIVSIVKYLEKTSLSSSESTKFLCENGISYIFIGQGQGQVSYGNEPLFTENELKQNPSLTLVYKKDRVVIFSLSPGVCGNP